jgi:hypothetical protein
MLGKMILLLQITMFNIVINPKREESLTYVILIEIILRSKL